MQAAATEARQQRAQARLRLSRLLCYTPVGLAAVVSLTELESVVSLRLALLLALGALAARGDRRCWRYLVRGPIGVLGGAMMLSLLWSENPRQTLSSLGAWALETLAAVAALAIGGRRAHDYLALVVKVVLIGSALLAILVPEVGRMPPEEAAWQGLFVHKNSLGTVAAFGLVLLATTGSRKQRIGWTSFALFILVASQSRAALAAALTGLLVQVVGRFVYTRRLKGRVTPASAFYGAVILGGLLVWRSSDRLLAALGRKADLTGRTDVWEEIVSYGGANPVWGSGMGAQIYSGSALSESIAAVRGYVLGTTHNGFLVVYLGLGVIGLWILAWVMVQQFVTIERARRSRVVRDDQVLLALGTLACYLVINVGEDRLLARSGWFFLMFGVLQLVRALPRSRPTGLKGRPVERTLMT